MSVCGTETQFEDTSVGEAVVIVKTFVNSIRQVGLRGTDLSLHWKPTGRSSYTQIAGQSVSLLFKEGFHDTKFETDTP
jgi:hypothetical protein